MKILKLEQNTPEWLEARKGKITGSKLKDIVVKRGNGRKIGFYRLIADRLAIEAEPEDDRERGHRLEAEALECLSKALKKEIEPVGLWVSDENENIAVSPDGVVKGTKNTESAEVKCLSAPYHLQAYFDGEVPDDYKMQVLQPFIVNPDLKKVHVGFYNPLVSAKPFFHLTISRKDVEEEIKLYREYQLNTLKEIEELLTQIAY